MKFNRNLAILITGVMIFSLAIAHGQIDRAKLGANRSIKFPAHIVLDERAQPVIASSGQVGFISSVTDGSIISFSITSGKMLSSVSVGHSVGPLSLIELNGRRFLAAPSANDPGNGHPATVSIIDVTSAKDMQLHSLIALPPSVQITPATRAYLTKDGKFCIIASSFADPALYSMSTETGQMVSWMPLMGRPSETAFYDKGGRRNIAIVSAQSNELVVIGVDEEGSFSLKGNFMPSGTGFDEANNPAFSVDGRSIYIAAAKSDKLFQINSTDASLVASLDVNLPQQVSVTRDLFRRDLIGVTRLAQNEYSSRGGVTIITRDSENLALKSEFNPPPSIEFSPANNVEFSKEAAVGFIGTATGMLFAFDVETGELQSHQTVGSELRRLSLSEKANAVAVVRSSSRGDEVIISSFDVVESEETDETAPVIRALKPDIADQGRSRNLKLTIVGDNFSEGSSVVINNSTEIASPNVIREGRALRVQLDPSLFTSPSEITVQVKSPNNTFSEPKVLTVVRPVDPTIERIKPNEMAGPVKAFALRVTGTHFRTSSVIMIGDQTLTTERVSDTELRAHVPASITGTVGKYNVVVADLIVRDLKSTVKELNIFGPRIKELKNDVDPEGVVAGTRSFNLRIIGENFRDGATVEINGEKISQSKVQKQNSNLIRLNVPGRFFQEEGELDVVVRNADGNASEPATLDSLPPEITSVEPGKILAGLSDVKVELRGERFRKKLRVMVKKDDGQFINVGKQRVHFRSSKRLTVTINKELNDLLAQQGKLQFQIINPNKGNGIPSVEKTLDIAGPTISKIFSTSLADDDSRKRIVIKGENFRKKSMIEFFDSNNSVIARREPETVREDRLSLTLTSRKLDALSNHRIRVVNPGKVNSNAISVRRIIVEEIDK